MAGGGRGAGLGRPVSRLERADHPRVLRSQHPGQTARRPGANHQPPEQLRLDQLQLRPDALAVDGRRRPGGSAGHRRGRPAEPGAAAAGMATRWPRSTTTSSCPWPAPGTSRRRCSGASPISGIASAAIPRGCGWPRRPSTSRRWKCWPRPAFASRSWRPRRPGGGASSARRTGSRSPAASIPSRAYLCRLPSGRSIVLFFYDGIVSQQVAFERLLDHGERFLERLFHGFDDRREHPQLMHIATDGESYGHHHAHGDMALAYVLASPVARTPTCG